LMSDTKVCLDMRVIHLCCYRNGQHLGLHNARLDS